MVVSVLAITQCLSFAEIAKSGSFADHGVTQLERKCYSPYPINNPSGKFFNM
jgi:hypothetical protein